MIYNDIKKELMTVAEKIVMSGKPDIITMIVNCKIFTLDLHADLQSQLCILMDDMDKQEQGLDKLSIRLESIFTPPQSIIDKIKSGTIDLDADEAVFKAINNCSATRDCYGCMNQSNCQDADEPTYKKWKMRRELDPKVPKLVDPSYERHLFICSDEDDYWVWRAKRLMCADVNMEELNLLDEEIREEDEQ